VRICTVTLYDHIGTGLILPRPTGIAYVQQVGGTACLQRACEGIFVPFGNDVAIDPVALLSPEPELTAYFEGPRHRGTGATRGLDTHDADVIDAVLGKFHTFAGVRVARDRLSESCEAWVHVSLADDIDETYGLWGVVTGLVPRPSAAILIWGNSD